MIIPGQHVKILVATKPVDFRKGHDGLAAVVQNELGRDPHSGMCWYQNMPTICPCTGKRRYLLAIVDLTCTARRWLTGVARGLFIYGQWSSAWLMR